MIARASAATRRLFVLALSCAIASFASLVAAQAPAAPPEQPPATLAPIEVTATPGAVLPSVQPPVYIQPSGSIYTMPSSPPSQGIAAYNVVPREPAEANVESADDPLDVTLVPQSQPLPRPEVTRYSCHTPCRLIAPVGAGVYRLVTRSRSDVRTVQLVDLPPGATRLRVTSAGPRGRYIAVLAGGGGVILVGFTALYYAWAFSSFSCPFAGCSSMNLTPYAIAALIIGGVGIAALIGGGLGLSGSKAQLETLSGTHAARRPIDFRLGVVPTQGGAFVAAGFTF